MCGRAEDQRQAEADEDHRAGVPVAEQGGEHVGEADGEEERGQLRDLSPPGPDAMVPMMGMPGMRAGRRVTAPAGGISRFAHTPEV
ncbi:hypothetical protein Msi02_56650 [Microbispora siamensis]|uniref:Uncharacterized protein n=1 Tax=Microbispora siamensis TaxID=564413 RepID=A0ABQ4GTX8_9ACTN|nr:hypothetical protein Msi02_56650 [Microbispora siamensis]